MAAETLARLLEMRQKGNDHTKRDAKISKQDASQQSMMVTMKDIMGNEMISSTSVPNNFIPPRFNTDDEAEVTLDKV